MIAGVVTGVVYGLGVRGVAKLPFRTADWLIWVMSVAFVFVVPFSMGYLAVAVKARTERVSITARLFLPWVVVLLTLLASALTLWEGAICIVMIAPIALVFGSVGGLVAGAVVQPSRPQAATMSMLCIAMLPFLVGPVERHLPPAADIRTVESDVVVHASPRTIWENIERVRRIDISGLPNSWNRRIGFPRPLEASLDREGIGGVRHATFAGDVLFLETIDTWEPERRLGFSIRADTHHIPSATLDEHVTVGGPYFDVLHGEYILAAGSDGDTILRLISRHRVSTDFNWYARLWTDAVMRDVQRSILYVIKNRCESVPR